MIPELRILFSALVVVLALASTISWVLRRKNMASPVIANLNARVNAWWVMVAVFAISICMGRTTLFVFYGLISFMALREFITLTPTTRQDHRTLAWIFLAILPLHYLFAWQPWYGMFLIFIPVYAFVLIPVRSALAGDTKDFLGRVGKMQWGVLVCVYFVSYLPMLLYMPIPGYQGKAAVLLFFVVFVTQVSDVMQYVFGKLFGKTPLAPSVSPSKTREGFYIGGSVAALMGTCLWWATPFLWWQALIFSAILVLSGFCGGLVMSAVKRSMGAKDWGHSIPGHGGVLDRLDSLLFSAPVFFHLVHYFFSSGMWRS